MNVLVIGGVAAGTKAAAKLKRCDRSAKVTIITKDVDISYAGCGLPYYVGGLIESRDELIINTPEKYAALTGVTVLTGREAVKVDPENKCVEAKNLRDNSVENYTYDELIIASGASASVPPVAGTDKEGVFTVRKPDDAINIRNYVDAEGVKKAVVVGAGFIGLEMAENLREKGVAVTIIDFANQVLPNVFDVEMADYVKRHLLSKGFRVLTGTSVNEVMGDSVVSGVITSSGKISADLVIFAAGIRPNTAFLADTGIDMFKGTILVNEQLMTNVPHVYAIGDCAMVKNRMTGKAQWSPMGSSANLEGRTLAQILTGSNKSYPGVLGTAIVKLPELNCARTGLSEAAAMEAGYEVETTVAITNDKAEYYPDAGVFITKLIADKVSHKLLGVQVMGSGAVDKMVDIAVMAINMGATLENFDNADFAYAPPFSTAIHPIVQAAYILLNKLNGDIVTITPKQYLEGAAKDYTVIDVGKEPSIRGARYIDFTQVEGEIEGLAKDEKILLVCNKGKRAYFLQNRMKFYGYTHTAVLEGATFFNKVVVKSEG
ncbi:MAG: FAD-dependent oxidoreductase, partial [Erysipelotrichaceae bacterium]|nr:FAD-dependent oxidoreductase [Erysipelotrichaceae bacterium]